MTADYRVGDLMLVLATVIWACLVVYLKRIIDHHNPVQIVYLPNTDCRAVFRSGSTVVGRPDGLCRRHDCCFIDSISSPGDGVLWFCRLEHAVAKIRRRGDAFVCFCDTDCWCFPLRAAIGRTHYGQNTDRPVFNHLRSGYCSCQTEKSLKCLSAEKESVGKVISGQYLGIQELKSKKQLDI